LDFELWGLGEKEDKGKSDKAKAEQVSSFGEKMTKKKNESDSRSPSGMTTKKAKAKYRDSSLRSE